MDQASQVHAPRGFFSARTGVQDDANSPKKNSSYNAYADRVAHAVLMPTASCTHENFKPPFPLTLDNNCVPRWVARTGTRSSAGAATNTVPGTAAEARRGSAGGAAEGLSVAPAGDLISVRGSTAPVPVVPGRNGCVLLRVVCAVGYKSICKTNAVTQRLHETSYLHYLTFSRTPSN